MAVATTAAAASCAAATAARPRLQWTAACAHRAFSGRSGRRCEGQLPSRRPDGQLVMTHAGAPKRGVEFLEGEREGSVLLDVSLLPPVCGARVQKLQRTLSSFSAATATHDAPFSPMTGLTVVVTGANGGIGMEFCKQLLEKGNKVIATCRRTSDALDVLVSENPKDFLITNLDVSDPESISAWAKDLASKVEHVDVCINNAGTTGLNGYERWELEDVTAEDMLHTFAINTVGPTLVVQQLLKNGLLGGEGSPSLVGNVTSKVGSVDDNSGGRGYAYRASKSAINIVTKSMSIDLKPHNVTCVLLHPGWVRTAMTEGRGLIDPDESARGLISVMEGAAGPINGLWYDYKLEPIPW